MKKSLFLTLTALAFLSAHILFSCTIFTVAKKGLVMAGNNEDGFNTNSNLWFVPGSEGKCGAVWVGFDVELGKMGAMNDRKNNDTKQAIRCYKKSLELDPANTEVAELLKKLGITP